MINWNHLFGMAEKALPLEEEKIDLVSSNLANMDTPGYKARDINFQKELDQYMTDGKDLPLDHEATIGLEGVMNPQDVQVLYRQPSSVSANGNSVEGNLEKKEFLNDAILYNSTLAFIQTKKAALMKALKGG